MPFGVSSCSTEPGHRFWAPEVALPRLGFGRYLRSLGSAPGGALRPFGLRLVLGPRPVVHRFVLRATV